ncbi:unnamed protein product [Chilo suppressalis]|uniref:Peptidase S1 domain-containing protein n=1 Tax=Chilo suppressalis TaxID=168631 RepID=A0ABN8B4C1_CHISP|nr:hypothetical protein evm_008612 [Chilo suppressalis]CAH0401919.1 unnamed protein product [Chilo suppressalis]
MKLINLLVLLYIKVNRGDIEKSRFGATKSIKTTLEREVDATTDDEEPGTGYNVTAVGVDSTTINIVGDSLINYFESLFEATSFPRNYGMPILNRKVFRGARVTIREHPYIVSIRRQFSHYLTGTLLTKNIIITVAHPIYEVPIADLQVVTGQNYNDRGTVLHTVVLVLIHENFTPSTLEADIALLMIYEEVDYRYGVKYIMLAPPRSSINGEIAFVTGWGRCDRTEKLIKFGMICAGVARSEDLLCPCMAVPGAPLVVDANVAGILSWGFGCGYLQDRPLVYTNLAVYQPWLIHNVPIITKIAKKHLESIFEATKAYLLSQWLNKTRLRLPDVEKPHSDEISPLELDTQLAKLDGTVFDIRDFLFNSTYRKKKVTMLRAMRKHLEAQVKIEAQAKVNKKMLRVNSFMSDSVLNESGLSLASGVLTENEVSEEESSNEDQ